MVHICLFSALFVCPPPRSGLKRDGYSPQHHIAEQRGKPSSNDDTHYRCSGYRSWCPSITDGSVLEVCDAVCCALQARNDSEQRELRGFCFRFMTLWTLRHHPGVDRWWLTYQKHATRTSPQISPSRSRKGGNHRVKVQGPLASLFLLN